MLLSEVRLAVSDAGSGDLSTRDRVYGSQDAAFELDDRTSAFEAGRGGTPHTCVAAFAAAGGARVRIVVGILPDPGLSFCVGRRVFNIPPVFFSGLGVLARSFVGTGVSAGEITGCKLLVRSMSKLDLSGATYDGLGGGAGLLSGVGGTARGRSE